MHNFFCQSCVFGAGKNGVNSRRKKMNGEYDGVSLALSVFSKARATPKLICKKACMYIILRARLGIGRCCFFLWCRGVGEHKLCTWLKWWLLNN